ncbi:MAG TPA: recombinase family protein [Candidatus Acidoferrales bacterium]|nr:recombinase family protein [Candidatus Acidoferrales bacterium]
MSKKAFAYLRVSGRDQVLGDGFDRQLEACHAFAAAQDYDIVEVFREKGVSGTKELDDRPALSELFAALEENGVKTVLIEKLDRLARDLMVQEAIIKDFMAHGFVLVSCYEPDLCSNDPTRKLIRQVIGAIAEYDKAMTVQKLRAARQRKSARGERGVGRHAFGEKAGEQQALQFILSHAGNQWTCSGIATLLNEHGFSTRSGRPWRGTTVAKIIRREQSAKNTPIAA